VVFVGGADGSETGVIGVLLVPRRTHEEEGDGARYWRAAARRSRRLAAQLR
jgi:hypothetical protein